MGVESIIVSDNSAAMKAQKVLDLLEKVEDKVDKIETDVAQIKEDVKPLPI